MGDCSSKRISNFHILEGGDRSVYKLTLEETYDLLKAMLALSLVELDRSPTLSAQDRCNEVWKRIANDRGVDWESIRPVPSGDTELFSAKKLI